MAVITAAVSGYKIFTTAKGMFSGQSKGFMEREANSKGFFDQRNEINAIDAAGGLTDAQSTRWNLLSFHKTDYNTRRENAAERAELDAFILWVQGGGGTETDPILNKSTTTNGKQINLAGFAITPTVIGILLVVGLVGFMLSRRGN